MCILCSPINAHNMFEIITSGGSRGGYGSSPVWLNAFLKVILLSFCGLQLPFLGGKKQILGMHAPPPPTFEKFWIRRCITNIQYRKGKEKQWTFVLNLSISILGHQMWISGQYVCTTSLIKSLSQCHIHARLFRRSGGKQFRSLVKANNAVHYGTVLQTVIKRV